MTVGVNEDVVWLEISIKNVLAVEVFNGDEDLADVIPVYFL
jgi:hypothetical protein